MAIPMESGWSRTGAATLHPYPVPLRLRVLYVSRSNHLPSDFQRSPLSAIYALFAVTPVPATSGAPSTLHKLPPEPKCDGSVPGCYGRCYGLSFCKHLLINKCYDVTA